jgi:hypothetical protein
MTRFGFVLCALLAACPAAAQEPASPPPAARDQNSGDWYRELSFNAFLSIAYSYNFNDPPSRTNQFRVFDFTDRSFKLDAAEFVVQKPVTKSGEAGFRVDAMVGSSIPRVAASAGLFRDSTGAAEDFDIHQAFVSYIVPIGRGLRLDGGKFVTYFAYEVIEGYDNYNDNYSRSFLFGYAVPFTHTGAKASYTFNDRVSGALFAVNGWDDAINNNASLSVGGQVTVVPHPRVTIMANYMGGPEREGETHEFRRLYELCASWKVAGRLSVAIDATRGRDENTPLPDGPGDATWSAVAGYARYTMTPRLAVAVRAERFADPDGARTGVAQRLSGLTLTPELKPAPHLVVRADIRVDRSDASVFETPSGLARRQTTIALNTICSF